MGTPHAVSQSVIFFVSGPYARGGGPRGPLAPPPPPPPTPKVPLISVKLGAILAHFRGIFNEKSKIFALATLAKKKTLHIFPQKKFAQGGTLGNFRLYRHRKKYQRGDPWFCPFTAYLGPSPEKCLRTGLCMHRMLWY